MLPQYSVPQKKKWNFKQSAAPTLATLAGAANGLRPLAARGLAGIKLEDFVMKKLKKIDFVIFDPKKS